MGGTSIAAPNEQVFVLPADGTPAFRTAITRASSTHDTFGYVDLAWVHDGSYKASEMDAAHLVFVLGPVRSNVARMDDLTETKSAARSGQSPSLQLDRREKAHSCAFARPTPNLPLPHLPHQQASGGSFALDAPFDRAKRAQEVAVVADKEQPALKRDERLFETSNGN